MATFWNKVRSEMRSKKKLKQLQQKSIKAPGNYLFKIRLGDLEARRGRQEEAIQYYYQAALECAKMGMVRHALALKKIILRLDPSRSLLGENFLEAYFQKSGFNSQDPLASPGQALEEERGYRSEEIPFFNGVKLGQGKSGSVAAARA